MLLTLLGCTALPIGLLLADFLLADVLLQLFPVAFSRHSLQNPIPAGGKFRRRAGSDNRPTHVAVLLELLIRPR
ncbi:MAG: hypothetical protein R3C12_17960 [Planctomycetaceae bacterium]